jgi:class 3 adenylate cyclase
MTRFLREAIAVHKGHVVKTTGDGFHAVFTAARDALEATVTVQRALVTTPWKPDAPPNMRMRVHAGEPICEAATTTAVSRTGRRASCR